MAGAGLLTILALLLIGVPLTALHDLVRLWRWWRHQPLPNKSHTRAGVASFVLAALAIYTVQRGGVSSMTELWCVAGVGAFAALWLVVGITGSQGALRYDPMQLFWWSVLGLAALAALYFKGLPF